MSTHGDSFEPHPALAAFAQPLSNGLFCFDSRQGDQTVVLVHGNGDEADTWRHVLPGLAASYRVIAVDLPGFGRSVPRDPGDLSALAAGALDLIEHLGLERVHLVGSSLGAAVTAKLATDAPDRVRSLTMVGGAPPSPDAQPSDGVRALLEPGVGEAYYNGLREQSEDAAYATLEPYYANLAGLPEADRAFLRARVWARVWSDTQRNAFFAALRSLFKDAFTPKFDGLPLLLVWGEHDQIVPLSGTQVLREAHPHAKLEIIAGSGHLPHQEHPEAFLRVLQAFLGEYA